MAKYIVGYTPLSCISEEVRCEHDNFEDAKFDILSYIWSYTNKLEDTKHINEYKDLKDFVNEYYNEEDVPFAVRVGMNNVWIEKSDNTSEEEE